MRSKPEKLDIKKKIHACAVSRQKQALEKRATQGLQDAKNYNAHTRTKQRYYYCRYRNMCYVKILSLLPVVLTNNGIARMQDYWITM